MSDPAALRLLTLETTPDGRVDGRPVTIGGVVAAPVVEASNIVRDARELITNAFGGRMRRYERLLEKTTERGLEAFRAKLAEEGYDGALGLRFANPRVVDGGAELIVYGTGFRFADR